ncbi:MAG: MarR family transcriptional regulator [Oscillospiraceae bacterium]|nr:MarR family transcriptional regulator [Oscillospiraceae bacterium]
MYDFEHMDKRLIAYMNIFVCANRLQAVMDSGLEGITSRQWVTIMMIDAFNSPPTLKQLSDISGVTHQSMRQIVDRLIEKGYLEITHDKTDKRAIRLMKTQAAEHIYTKDPGESEDFVYKLFSCLDDNEAEVFCTALEKLCVRLKEIKEDKCD